MELVLAEGAVRIAPPEWEEDAGEEPKMLPRQPPVPVPFGAPHTVRTVGPGTACWAYVFGVSTDGDQ